MTNTDYQSTGSESTVESKFKNDGFAVFYFLWIGALSNTIWNAIMNSFPFFTEKFPNDDVAFVFPLPFHIAALLIVLCITQLSNKFSYNARILMSVAGLVAVSIVLPIAANIFGGTGFGFHVTLALVFLGGFFNNLVYASVAGFTSQIDGKYTAYFLIGVAIGGLAVSFLRSICDKLFEIIFNEDDPAADMRCNFIFFGIIVSLFYLGVMFHYKFMKSTFYDRYCRKRLYSVFEDNEEGLLNPQNQDPARSERGFRTLFQVFREIRFFMFLMILVSVQQHMAYPGLMLLKQIPDEVMHHTTKTTSMILTFSVFYIVGKKMGQYRKYYTKYTMVFLILFRFVLMVFFLLQAVPESFPIIDTLVFGYFNITLFAICMGVVNVGLFILAPEIVSDEKKEVAGFLAVFAINVGTLLGDVAALPLKHLGLH